MKLETVLLFCFLPNMFVCSTSTQGQPLVQVGPNENINGNSDVTTKSEKRQYEHTLESSHEVNAKLIEVFWRLRSFANESVFDDKDFNRQAEDICGMLANLRTLIDKHPLDVALIKQHSFFSEMYQELLTAVDVRIIYRGPDSTQRIIRRLVQFNIKLLAFHDSHGCLDSSIENCSGKLERLAQILNKWGVAYENFRHVPSSVQGRFYTEYERAQQRLRRLRNECSRHH